MDIPATTPEVVPPTPELVFDRWIIPSVIIDWPGVDQPLNLTAVFRIATRDANGKLLPGQTIKAFLIDNLWDLIAQDVEVAQAFGIFTATLTKKARESGVI